MLKKIVSGGQTGVDRGALDAALEVQFPCGGWCPRGRKAEDGRIPARYPLAETDSPNYLLRTEQNVVDSDATVIFYFNAMEGGTSKTQQLCQRHNKPYISIDLSALNDAQACIRLQVFLTALDVQILNVAGPRASKHPRASERTRNVIRQLLLADGKSAGIRDQSGR